jgi:hypothetical protein
VRYWLPTLLTLSAQLNESVVLGLYPTSGPVSYVTRVTIAQLLDAWCKPPPTSGNIPSSRHFGV